MVSFTYNLADRNGFFIWSGTFTNAMTLSLLVGQRERGQREELRKGEIVVNASHEIDSMDCVRAFSNCAYREVMLELGVLAAREEE